MLGDFRQISKSRSASQFGPWRLLKHTHTHTNTHTAGSTRLCCNSKSHCGHVSVVLHQQPDTFPLPALHTCNSICTCVCTPTCTRTHVPFLPLPFPFPVSILTLPCPCPNTHAPIPTHGACIWTRPHLTLTRPLAHSPTRPLAHLQSCHSLPGHPLSTCVAPLLSARSWAALRAYTKASSSTRIVAPANRTSSTCRDPSARGVLFPVPALAPPDRGPCLRSADACPLPAHLALPPLALLWLSGATTRFVRPASIPPSEGTHGARVHHCSTEALDSACQPACLYRCRLLVSPSLTSLTGHWKTSAPRPGLQSRDHP